MVRRTQRRALHVAAIVFGAVAALHLLRLVAGTAITVGGTVVPVIVSLPAGLALGALAAWMVIAARRYAIVKQGAYPRILNGLHRSETCAC